MKILMTIIYIVVVGQVGFFFGLSLPRDCFNEYAFPYKPFTWEKNGKIYDKLHIKKWKSRVPDMSDITKRIFPKKIKRTVTSADVDRLIKESCIAEMVHYVMCIFAMGIYNIWKGRTGFWLAMAYIFVGNLPYVVIQRYNRPHFIALRDKLKIREERILNV